MVVETIGILLKSSDMPFTKDGIQPDIILNPNAIPSRMTIGQLIECILGKVSAIEGHDADGTPFNDIDLEEVKERLNKLGYNRDGMEYLYNGMTGQKMKVMIFIGPTYYQRLKHLVEDKIHCFSESHDVLTSEGWKNITKITINDKVATLNNGELKYENPTNVMAYPDYEGSMYYIKNQSVDLEVTGNHRMWVSHKNKHNKKWSEYDFERADNLVGKIVKYKKDAEWNVPDYKIDKDIESWLTSFGTLPECVMELSKSQTQKLLNAMLSDKNEYQTSSIILVDQLQQLCLHAGWAGVIRKNNDNNNDDNWIINVMKDNMNPIVNDDDDYDDEQEERLVNEKCSVYCIQVPSEVFYVRRNGKSVWTGNSRSRGPRTILTRQAPEGCACLKVLPMCIIKNCMQVLL